MERRRKVDHCKLKSSVKAGESERERQKKREREREREREGWRKANNMGKVRRIT